MLKKALNKTLKVPWNSHQKQRIRSLVNRLVRQINFMFNLGSIMHMIQSMFGIHIIFRIWNSTVIEIVDCADNFDVLQILGKPSKELMEVSGKAEEQRLKDQQVKLGKDGLSAKSRALEMATEENEVCFDLNRDRKSPIVWILLRCCDFRVSGFIYFVKKPSSQKIQFRRFAANSKGSLRHFYHTYLYKECFNGVKIFKISFACQLFHHHLFPMSYFQHS